MTQLVTIKLSRIQVGQIVEGLKAREQSYRETAYYLETGEVYDIFFNAEEVSDSAEARAIANLYEEIIRELESELSSQTQSEAA
jgi:hypothetical protein